MPWIKKDIPYEVMIKKEEGHGFVLEKKQDRTVSKNG
ncbi:MAG: hypothetical protein Ct9H300mP6_17510 [Gammaproteobacteria bacterium]|nr:MAG: hypothetical protein Ct9H300mP6_17510 [Gammaproteobacteria bacterium]